MSNEALVSKGKFFTMLQFCINIAAIGHKHLDIAVSRIIALA